MLYGGARTVVVLLNTKPRYKRRYADSREERRRTEGGRDKLLKGALSDFIGLHIELGGDGGMPFPCPLDACALYLYSVLVVIVVVTRCVHSYSQTCRQSPMGIQIRI